MKWATDFVGWLNDTLLTQPPAVAVRRLIDVASSAPSFRDAHPREEHFTPLNVVIGAAYPHVPVPATQWSAATPPATATAVAAGGAQSELPAAVASAAAEGERSTGSVLFDAMIMGHMSLASYRFD